MKTRPARPTLNSPAGKIPAEAPRRRVFLVDDHPMMRDGMGRLIDSEPGLMCCGGAPSAEEAISEIPRCHPDLVNSPGSAFLEPSFTA